MGHGYRMPGLRAGAGSRPAASNFLSRRRKKVTKERATPSLRPLRGAKGQTCVGAVAGCAVELALRCARRSDSHGEPEHEAWALRRPCSPRNRPAAGAASRGGQPNSRTTPRAIAALGPGCAARGACARELGPSAAQRSNGPCGCHRVPFWMRLGRAGRGVARVLRELTHRSCSSGAPQARSEFCGAPRDRAPQVAPQRSEGVADSRVAFSWVTFSWRDKRKLLRRRVHTPAPALQPGTPPNRERCERAPFRKAQPDRMK